MGCVFAEFLIGQAIFPGENSVDQLVEIIKVLGTPTREQIQSMNRNYNDFRFPDVPTQPWSRIIGSHCPLDALDLLSKLLTYSPHERIGALDACAHPFFDELRNSPDGLLPNGSFVILLTTLFKLFILFYLQINYINYFIFFKFI